MADPLAVPEHPSSAAGSWRERVAGLVPLSVTPSRAAGAVAALVIGGVLVFLLLRPAAPPPEIVLPRAVPEAAPATGGGGGGSAPARGAVGQPDSATGEAAEPNPPVAVHVAGAVVHPGVYAVASGSRVVDAVAAAGGPVSDADVDQLNLAARVSDGDRVQVPKRGEVVSGPTAGGSSPGLSGAAGPAAGPVDLNRATAQQLDALPGVGPATAAAILAWRDTHGRFRAVSELLDVRGIGPAKLEALRPLVKV
ncbi:MAG: helix-hairpin-helix domain-containing protein [Acidimicrobiales bacterium]